MKTRSPGPAPVLDFPPTDAGVAQLNVRLARLAQGQAALNGNSVVEQFGIGTLGNTSGTSGGQSGQFVIAASQNLTAYQSTGAFGTHTVIINGPELFSAGVSTGGATAGNTGTVSRQIVFVGSNGITLNQATGASDRATITVVGPGHSAGIYASSNTTGAASSTTVDLRSVTLRGMGAISIGASASEIIVSVPNTVAQTNQTLGLVASGNTTAQSSSSTYDARSVTIRGAGAASVGASAGNEFVVSVPVQTNQALNIFASSNTTAQSSSTVLDARSFTIRGVGAISVGASAGELILSVPVGGGAGDGYNLIAAGTQTAASTGTVLFQSSNGITFGMSDSSVVTATVRTNYAGSVGAITGGSITVNTDGVSVNLPAYLTTAAASNHSHGNPSLALTNLSGSTASASNGFTLSLNAYGSGANPADVAVVSANGTNVSSFAVIDHQHRGVNKVNINLDAGGGAGATTNFYGNFGLYAGNNITFSTSGTADSHGSITINAPNPGGAGANQSYYMWPDEIQNSSAWQVSGSTSYVQPVYLPFAMSASYIRLPLTLSCIGSMASVATAANATRGMTVSSTFNAAFYSQGTGASSRSLVLAASGSGSWVQRATAQAAGVGSNWTTGHTISFPREGGDTAFTSTGAGTVTNITMQSSQLSDFTGLRFVDIPFANSLAAGAYWFMFGSSTSISTSGTANYSTMRFLASNFVATQLNQAFALMGSATNSSVHFRNGLGSYTTNTIATVMSSIALANISTSASNPIMVFQMIRQA